ncbi:MAG: SlyX family protein [Stappiaceae bacterium]
MENSIEARLDRLEIDLAHANVTIDELNEVVTDQAGLIDRLKRKMKSVEDQLGALEDRVTDPDRIEKPPHY